MGKLILPLILGMLFAGVPVWGEEKQDTATTKTMVISDEDMEIIEHMDTLEHMEIAEQLSLLQEMDILAEDEMYDEKN